MLRNSKNLEGCAIGATDGAIGEVKDLYFDDEAWIIRYLVVGISASEGPALGGAATCVPPPTIVLQC